MFLQRSNATEHRDCVLESSSIIDAETYWTTIITVLLQSQSVLTSLACSCRINTKCGKENRQRMRSILRVVTYKQRPTTGLKYINALSQDRLNRT